MRLHYHGNVSDAITQLVKCDIRSRSKAVLEHIAMHTRKPPFAAHGKLTLVIRLLTWISRKHSIHGLPVWAPLVANEERPLIYRRLDDALSLLKANAPGRYERVRQSLKGFLIFGIDSINASYDPTTAVCRLGEKFMLAPDTTPEAVACTVVHEATHGRLFRLGIPYDEPLRYRVEMICIKAALFTAQRLSGAEAQVERCRGQLTIDPNFFSTDSYAERAANNLRAAGLPEWLIRTLVWIRRKRAAKLAAL